MCFFEPTYSTICNYCEEPCYNSKGFPYKTFDYLPIIHQLCLLWADPIQAHQLKSYRNELAKNSNPKNVIRDFWDTT